MTKTTATLQWSENVLPARVETGEQLDQLLDRLSASSRSDFPITARLHAHGCVVDILLGLPESFVYLDELSPTRYFITMGDSRNSGLLSFHLLGQHHTEFERRHLIPAALAHDVLREFFDTGARSAKVEWEENWY